MGLLSELLGNASEVDLDKIIEEYQPILGTGEEIELALKVIRDLFIFTNKRLLLADKQGMTGKKTEYHSIPYISISHYAVITAGHFDMDAELRIWLTSSNEPIVKDVKSGDSILKIQKALATFVG